MTTLYCGAWLILKYQKTKLFILHIISLPKNCCWELWPITSPVTCTAIRCYHPTLRKQTHTHTHTEHLPLWILPIQKSDVKLPQLLAGLRPWNTRSTLKARWAFSCRPLRFFNGPLWGPCCDNLRRWGKQQTFQRGWPHTWRSTASLPCQPRSSPWYWWPKQGSLTFGGWDELDFETTWNPKRSMAQPALSAVYHLTLQIVLLQHFLGRLRWPWSKTWWPWGTVIPPSLGMPDILNHHRS